MKPNWAGAILIRIRVGSATFATSLFPMAPDAPLRHLIGDLSYDRPFWVVIFLLVTTSKDQPRIDLGAKADLVAFKHLQIVSRTAAGGAIKRFVSAQPRHIELMRRAS